MAGETRTSRDLRGESVATAELSLALRHRAHDYAHLVKRWRAVAKAAGFKMRSFTKASGYDVFYLASPAKPGPNDIYISAGIHGDEAASTEGLITWAEENIERMRELPCLLFPCLNPWGLVNNSRRDESGCDLNRAFKDKTVPFIAAWKSVMAGRRFALALTLHEDYDGNGIYLYELETAKPYWAEELLREVSNVLPIETRTRIDGRRASNGFVRRKVRPNKFPLFPEAIYLHLFHCARVFTVETPSEFYLDQRVKAHVLIIDECLRRLAHK